MSTWLQCAALLLCYFFTATATSKQFFNVSGTGNTSYFCNYQSANIGACQYQGLYPGGFALDTTLRSRWAVDSSAALNSSSTTSQWDGGSTSTSPSFPGIAADAKFTVLVENSYYYSKKQLEVDVQLDHVLCTDRSCRQLVDLFWAAPAKEGEPPRISTRFSSLNALASLALPIWAIGAETPPPVCTELDLTGATTQVAPTLQGLQQCTWDGSKLQEVSPPLLASVPYLAKGLIGQLNDRVRFKYGNFIISSAGTNKGCVTLVIPVSPYMEELGWTADDNCSEPSGLYLFHSYFMPAFVHPIKNFTLDGNWQAQVHTPAADPAKMARNADFWLQTFPWYPPYITCRAESLDIGLGSCEVYDLAAMAERDASWHDNIPDCNIISGLPCQYELLFIGKKPIWALSTIDEVFDFTFETGPVGADVDVGKELYKAAESTQPGYRPWCTGSSSCNSIDQSLTNSGFFYCVKGKDGQLFNVFNCNETQPRGLLDVRFQGGPLHDLSSLAVPSTCSSGILGEAPMLAIMNEGFVYDEIVERAVSNTLLTASYEVEGFAQAALAATDTVYTFLGAVAVLLLGIITSIAVLAGLDGLLVAGTPLIGKFWAAWVALAVVFVTTWFPSIAFLVQEYSNRRNNAPNDRLAWVLVPSKGRGNLHVATAVAMHFSAKTSRWVLPCGWANVVVSVIATIVAAFLLSAELTLGRIRLGGTKSRCLWWQSCLKGQPGTGTSSSKPTKNEQGDSEIAKEHVTAIV